MGFFNNYFKNAAKNAEGDIISLIRKFDFKGAEAADLDTMEDILNKASGDLAAARNGWKKENSDVVQKTTEYNKLIAEVEKCQAAIDNPAVAEATKQKATAYMEASLTKLEDMTAILEKEKEEEKDAREYMDLLEETVRAASDNLVSAREALKSRKMKLDTLELKKKNNEEKANRAAVLAGLREQGSSMGKVLESLDKDIAKAQNAADASQIKADALMAKVKPVAKPVDDDLAAILGTPNKATESVADRLARLKKVV